MINTSKSNVITATVLEELASVGNREAPVTQIVSLTGSYFDCVSRRERTCRQAIRLESSLVLKVIIQVMLTLFCLMGRVTALIQIKFHTRVKGTAWENG